MRPRWARQPRGRRSRRARDRPSPGTRWRATAGTAARSGRLASRAPRHAGHPRRGRSGGRLAPAALGSGSRQAPSRGMPPGTPRRAGVGPRAGNEHRIPSAGRRLAARGGTRAPNAPRRPRHRLAPQQPNGQTTGPGRIPGDHATSPRGWCPSTSTRDSAARRARRRAPERRRQPRRPASGRGGFRRVPGRSRRRRRRC